MSDPGDEESLWVMTSDIPKRNLCPHLRPWDMGMTSDTPKRNLVEIRREDTPMRNDTPDSHNRIHENGDGKVKAGAPPPSHLP